LNVEGVSHAIVQEVEVGCMKIAHVVDSMDVGGAETLVSQMCRLQKEQGHDPRVYAVATLGDLGEQMRKEGFDVVPHVGRNLSEASRNFYRIFKELRPEVVHLHNPTPTIFAAVPARIAGVPSIVSTRHSLVARPRNLVVETKYAVAALCCDWIVGICDATRRNMYEAHNAPTRKIARIYNGALRLRSCENEKRPGKTGFTLLYVGRLVPVKNHTLLLNAFRAALSSMPDLRLWMVGEGSERPKLEALADELGISNQITFWGQQLDVAPFFSAADAFIMSSTSEGLPMSLIQAFSLGVPVIVTDVGGMTEVVHLSKAGFTVSPIDPAEMTEAILRLAGDAEARQQFSRSAAAAFETHFALQAMVDSYMNLYRNTARGRRIREV
jgi:glycosyltransferase involved in cell wall biosynthesis